MYESRRIWRDHRPLDGRANAASWVRLATDNLAEVRERWVLTVSAPIASVPAISGLLRPLPCKVDHAALGRGERRPADGGPRTVAARALREVDCVVE